MSDRQQKKLSDFGLRTSLRDMGKTFFHPWSLVVAGIIAAALGLAGPWVNDDSKIVEIGMSIFQVSGTMVALVLPASELANAFITKFSDKLVVLIVGEGVPDEKAIIVIHRLTKQLRDNLQPAWRASVYALSSFLLSGVVMFVERINVTVRGVSFSWGLFLLGLSLGFVMVGAFWFFPTARYIFRLKLLDDIEEKVGSKKVRNINDAYQTLVFAAVLSQLSEQWLKRIIADSRAMGQSIPARLCCFRRDNGTTWYGGCEIQGGDCHYFGEGCPSVKRRTTT